MVYLSERKNMIVYTKLWILLDKKGMKKTDLKQVITSATLAKLGKNETVSVETIGKICDFLQCQPADIMENVSKEQLEKVGEEISEKLNLMLNMVTEQTGMSKEALTSEVMKNMATVFEKWQNGEENPLDVIAGINNEENKKDPTE